MLIVIIHKIIISSSFIMMKLIFVLWRSKISLLLIFNDDDEFPRWSLESAIEFNLHVIPEFIRFVHILRLWRRS